MAPGQISFMGKPDSLQGKKTKGNVFLERGPICDKGWSYEDATVACRFTIIWCGSISSTSSHQDVGIWPRFPWVGVNLWLCHCRGQVWVHWSILQGQWDELAGLSFQVIKNLSSSWCCKQILLFIFFFLVQKLPTPKSGSTTTKDTFSILHYFAPIFAILQYFQGHPWLFQRQCCWGHLLFLRWIMVRTRNWQHRINLLTAISNCVIICTY